MLPFVDLLLHVLVSPFKTQARLEAEIIMLRHLSLPKTSSTLA